MSSMREPMDELERRRLNERGRQILREKKGVAVRPMRQDGYVNLMNKYGTTQDNSEAYRYQREPLIPDMQLASLYEGNGLFSKIIDTPAEEALKHGFDLHLKNEDIDAFVKDALDDLEWEDKAATAIKWARLYGGAIIVMLIDDGRGLEEPLDWQSIRSVDELRVYERSIVQADHTSLYMQDVGKGVGNRVSKFGQPEFFYVSSIYGSFRVHESRCLVFKNGILPEQCSNAIYQFWGAPEYLRIRRALRETTTAHSDSVKLLERSVQAIYSMKGMASLLTTDDGENQVLRRLQIIDQARGLLNSIAIDSEGENYDFKTSQFSGVKDVIDATCNMLSALSGIPQTLLFGRSPAGENSTGESDFESYYNFVDRIRKMMLKRNLRNLIDVIFRAGTASGEITEEPRYKLEFDPLWSMSETEQAAVEKTRAETALVKAQTAQIYVDMQAVDPSEVRTGLASDDEFNVEDLVDEDNDLLETLAGIDPSSTNELEAAQKNAEEMQTPGGAEQSVANSTQNNVGTAEVDAGTYGYFPEFGMWLEENMNATPEEQAAAKEYYRLHPKTDGEDTNRGVGVLVVKDGKLLCGTRVKEGTICGPGGHIEDGETAEQAAIRETKEEFGITPKELIPIAELTGMPPEYCDSQVFLCTEYDGKIACKDEEMTKPGFITADKVIDLMESNPERLFLPFGRSVVSLLEALGISRDDENSRLTTEGKRDRLNETNYSLDEDQPRDEKGQFASVGSGGNSGSGTKSSGSGVVGKTTSTGVTIKRVSNHAFDRIKGRSIKESTMDKLLSSTNVTPGNTSRTQCFEIKGYRAVVDTKSGTLVTVMHRRNNK